MADFTATFEAGANGDPITTAPGEASATAWDDVDQTPTYSNLHPHTGTLSASVDNLDKMIWNAPGGTTDHYGRVYMYLTGDSGNDFTSIARTNLSGGVAAPVAIFTGRKFTITWNGGFLVGNTVAPLNQLVRVEYHVVHSNTVGSIETKIYLNSDSTTPDETISQAGVDTQTEAGTYEFGILNVSGGGAPSPIFLDDIVANATSYPGPTSVAPANTVAPVASGSPVVGHTLSVTDGTWTGTAPITFTYQWQRDNSGGGVYGDIGGETNNTYLLAVADLGCNVRAVVTGTNGGGAVPANSNARGPVTNPSPPSGGGKPPSRLVVAGEGQTIVLGGR